MINEYSYNTPYRTPMQLGNVSFDATMERSQTYSADVPTYPVEKGFKISDAVLKNPLEISLKAVISEMPLTFGYSYGAYGWYRSVEQVINELKKIYFDAEPVTLYTNFGNYPSLVIQSMTIPETTEMVNAVEVSITLKQVSITGNYDIEAHPTGGDAEDYSPTGADAGPCPILASLNPKDFTNNSAWKSYSYVAKLKKTDDSKTLNDTLNEATIAIVETSNKLFGIDDPIFRQLIDDLFVHPFGIGR